MDPGDLRPDCGVVLLVAGLIAIRNRPLQPGWRPSSCWRASEWGCSGRTSTWCAPSCRLPPGRAHLDRPAGVGAADPRPADLRPGRRARHQRAWVESPPDSGVLCCRAAAPADALQQDAGVLLLGLDGMSGDGDQLSSRSCPHRVHNPWLWIPTAVGVFATIVALVLGALDDPSPTDCALPGEHAADDPGRAGGRRAACQRGPDHDECAGDRAFLRGRRYWRRCCSATWAPRSDRAAGPDREP